MRSKIEQHFKHYWDNDRTAVVNQEYFERVPYNVKKHIMCKFLFEDVIAKNKNYKNFFRIGNERDANFVYKITYGFMPR